MRRISAEAAVRRCGSQVPPKVQAAVICAGAGFPSALSRLFAIQA